MNNDIENLKKRLIYRSQYRGTKEMDKLVGSFVKKNINGLTLKQLQELEKFLSLDDDTLYKIYNNQITNQNFKDISKKFLDLYKSHIYEK